MNTMLNAHAVIFINIINLITDKKKMCGLVNYNKTKQIEMQFCFVSFMYFQEVEGRWRQRDKKESGTLQNPIPL